VRSDFTVGPADVGKRLGLQAGLARFNHSSHMILVWVHFLENVLQHKGTCGSQLLAAKKLNPNWCDRSVGGAGGRDATSP